MKDIANIIFFTFMAIFMVSCHKQESGNPTIYVTNYVQNKVPYYVGQQLRFLSNYNDTLDVLISKKTEIIYFWRVCSTCTNDENIHYYLINKNQTPPNDTLADIVLQSSPFDGIYLFLRSPLDSTIGFGAVIHIDRDTHEFSCPNNTNCLDTLKINSNIYTNVLKYTSVSYSAAKGILKFKFNDGHEYSLIE